VWLKNCQTKYNIYLLYSTRPKDSTKQYYIHIDIYKKSSLNYRGSLLLPIQFLFLPVQRLAFFVDIPRTDDKTQSCSKGLYVHRKCGKYSNNPRSFCQYDPGWSGKYRKISHNCTCSSDSLCIGISFQNSRCENDGRCVASDVYLISNQEFA
jgi:hypothetical protein